MPTARPREAIRALSSPAYTSTTRPLDALAAGIVVVLCLSWGFNQVATKLAIHDIPPLTQAAVRSTVAGLLISAWCRLRGIPLLKDIPLVGFFFRSDNVVRQNRELIIFVTPRLVGTSASNQ